MTDDQSERDYVNSPQAWHWVFCFFCRFCTDVTTMKTPIDRFDSAHSMGLSKLVISLMPVLSLSCFSDASLTANLNTDLVRRYLRGTSNSRADASPVARTRNSTDANSMAPV